MKDPEVPKKENSQEKQTQSELEHTKTVVLDSPCGMAPKGAHIPIPDRYGEPMCLWCKKQIISKPR